jgi:hypothetical protein
LAAGRTPAPQARQAFFELIAGLTLLPHHVQNFEFSATRTPQVLQSIISFPFL